MKIDIDIEKTHFSTTAHFAKFCLLVLIHNIFANTDVQTEEPEGSLDA